ncbi:MAG: Txe/YoeB family addiction module toxin [Eubacteriales bacterium]
MYEVVFSRRADKEKRLIKQAGLEKRAKEVINILCENPFQNPPPYEKLTGNLAGFYSRRINIQHRLVYTVHETEKIVAVRSIWTHYE